MGDEIRENENAYIGDGGQLRLDPPRKFKWSREGVHFAIGLYCSLLATAVMLLATEGLMWAVIAMQPVVVAMFLVYEITEGRRLNDWSFRDIAGYMAGWLFGLTLFVILAILGASQVL